MSNDEDAEGRRWEALNPEILTLIFVRIQPVDEMVRCVPFVCKSWMEVVAGPYCWQDINLFPWWWRCTLQRRFLIETVEVDAVVGKLVQRSSCTLQRLSVNKIGESGFLSVLNCGRCLKWLQIPNSSITDDMVLKHVRLLPNLIYLDISYCIHITHKGIAAFGNNCKSLVFLTRNRAIDDSEAMTIAHTMPNLQRIKLGYGGFGNLGLSEILTKCKSLTHLDIRGCRKVELDGDLMEICGRLVHFQSIC
ncbi:hypothetical protein OSB04_012750 [Centaurea solstitialis]|uniref:F-box domain-containing protein n=1 Tax=Centaurea solstitialis TaxID=347529 RepID=A0AA38TPW2_9ASTR|nr:hypothetical protein OSB04_012750 [Centaurea solstitialis]